METLHQKISRMILGVHKKTSILATLGEHGRVPPFIKGLCHVMKYYANICKSEGNGSLIGHAIKEMKTAHNPTITSWFSREEKIKNISWIKIFNIL